MPRELSDADKIRLYEAYLKSQYAAAIQNRAQGLFDAANYFEERAHQWENMEFIWDGDFPGMESAWLDELVRVYGKMP